jgi:hypothetical protein
MRLYEAAVSCRVYTAFGGEFDDSLREFVVKAGGTLNLESAQTVTGELHELVADAGRPRRKPRSTPSHYRAQRIDVTKDSGRILLGYDHAWFRPS